MSRSSSNWIVRGEQCRRFAVDVGVGRLEEPLRSLFVRGDGAVPGVLDELPLPLLGDRQGGGVEALAVAPAVDREVRPVLASALPEAHGRNSSTPVWRADDGSVPASTALARTKSSRSAGR